MFTPLRTRLISLLALLTLSATALAQPATSADVAGSAANDTRKAVGVEAIKAIDHVGQQRYALVIGINDYADAKIPDLTLCEKDAKAIYDVLTSSQTGGIDKANTTLLVGKDATSRNIRKALADLRKIPADATVFIYFSGHGAKEGDEAFWVTQDCELADLAATALPDRDVRAFLDRIPSSRVIVMIDSCYAAATVKGGKALATEFDAVLSKFTGKGRAYLMAAGSGEEAIEAKDLKHSVFTHYLVEGLSGKADDNGDGVVVLPELTNYIDKHVADEARIRGGVQKPVVKLDDVQEPSKFKLTIDADRLQRNLQETTQSKLLREKRLSTLEKLYLDDKLTRDQTQLGQLLLGSDPSKLDENDRKRLTYFAQVLDGELTPDKLQRALDLIETPAQRQARLAKEAAMRAEAERLVREAAEKARMVEMENVRQTKITDLWKTALANDNKTAGKAALAALEELLKLDPNHGEAKKLREKISGYFGPPVLDLGNGVKLATVKIQSGKFTMGSPASEAARKNDETQKSVTIDKDFYMGESEVTQAQWKAVMGTTPWKGQSNVKEGDAYPATYVSWDDAQAFMQKLSQLTGKKVRLPSEAEWEYACRAGTTTAYSFGDSDRNLSDYAWWRKNAFDIGEEYAHEVKTKKPNPWGLYDMHGNVWEWCEDRYDATSRVLRGGCWIYSPEICRSAYRGWDSPVGRDFNVGFRVVLDF